jgi:predicted ArsR family transcriptional regulator
MLEQARDMTRAIDRFEGRVLTTDPNSSEGNQRTRDELQQIRDSVKQMIERGVDPGTMEKARQALDQQAENSLAVATDRNGRPEVVFRADEDGRTIRWNSDERALAQVLNEVERGATRAQVLDSLSKDNRECPPSFQERYTNSEQYRQWQASERERELSEREMNERRRRNSLAQVLDRGPQGLGRER